MTRPVLEFWCDFASPLAYPAAMTLARRAPDHDVAIAWRPFRMEGDPGEVAWDDVARACEGAGVPFRRPSVFPRDSGHAVRAALACAAEGLDIAAFSRAVFDANFARDQDIADVGRLGEILTEIDYPGGAVMERALSPEVASALEAAQGQARDKGVRGGFALLAPDGRAFSGSGEVGAALAHAGAAASGG